MAFSRYARSRVLKKNGRMFYPSSQSAAIIRRAVQFGVLKTEPFVLSEGQRLDLVSANFYGDAQYWWVIAAASGIGWQCQVPAGTYLRIPSSLSEVRGLVA